MVTSEYSQKSRPESAGENLLRFVEGALSRAAVVWHALRNRRSVAKLLDWDDRMLRDIGLTPGDVRAVMATPVGEDPSLRLSILSVERRTAVRATAHERLSHVHEPVVTFRDAERGTRRHDLTLLDFET
jgi:uncharacterized protein YjiS (DUF1127 family)